MRHLVVGTAGHIDHGKSALVEALTGVHPDRLAEERRRGITIELGFADLPLPPEGIVGFVDVPGHERFVRHMVAGASGFDAAMLVIAADDGVKPQTREHLAILSLLGVGHGLVVLSKSDLVDQELLELVELEVRELVAGTFLERAPLVPASAKTGAGLPEVRAALRALFAIVPARAASGVPRLAIDRSFAMRGFGTVVTGTLTSGTLRVGDEIEILPSGARARIRGLQMHKRAVESAASGRVAVNLQGLSVRQAPRGATLTSPGALRPTRVARVEVAWLPGTPEAAKRGAVRFHHGTAERDARIRPIAGEPGFAEVRFASPAVLVPGDRFVLRRPEPLDTIGGGVVSDAHPSRRSSSSDLLGDRIVRAGTAGVAAAEVATETARTLDEIEAEVADRETKGTVVRAANRIIDRASWDAAADAVLRELRSRHGAEPLRSGIPREAIRKAAVAGMSLEVFRVLLESLAERGTVRVFADRIAEAGHEVRLTPPDAKRLETVEQAFREAGLDPPDAAAAGELGGPQGSRFLDLLVDQGRLVRIVDGRLFHADALEALRRKVRDHARTSTTMDVATFKDLAGVTRKNAIPLLEQLDAERMTRRVGNVREIVARDVTP